MNNPHIDEFMDMVHCASYIGICSDTILDSLASMFNRMKTSEVKAIRYEVVCYSNNNSINKEHDELMFQIVDLIEGQLALREILS